MDGVVTYYLIIADRMGMGTAEASLAALGYELYYPREKIAVTRLNRRVKIERPLLYKYAFVKGDNPHAIQDAKGVFQVLRDYTTGKFALVSERTVERFRRKERYGEYDRTRRGKRSAVLKAGQPVMIVDGHWINWQGVVERCGAFKAHVDMGSMVIEFPVDVLEAV